jgi:hypothetical protein
MLVPTQLFQCSKSFHQGLFLRDFLLDLPLNM